MFPYRERLRQPRWPVRQQATEETVEIFQENDPEVRSARALTADLVRWRRQFHSHPELGFEEVETQRFVLDTLRDMGLDPRPIARTGVVVDIGTAPFVLVRADMDALPVQEEGDLAFRSQNQGIMHACGHDGHMAIALGTAAVLQSMTRATTPGVRVIFQPSEERHPGGAPSMIEEGVLEGVTRVTGCHIRPTVPLGQVGAVTGAQSANSDRFSATVIGRGGHGSAPQNAIDPVPVVAEIVLALQTLVSRRIAPSQQAVVTVGSLHAGTASNVIPDTATLHATVRTFESDVQALLSEAIPRIVEGIAQTHGARAEVEYVRGYPSVVNSAREVALFQDAARTVLGPEGIYPLNPTMGGEDFAFFLQKRPGVYWILGAQIPGRPGGSHSPRFAFNEDALPIGVAVMVKTALALAAEPL
jgi:amidohydrolase